MNIDTLPHSLNTPIPAVIGSCTLSTPHCHPTGNAVLGNVWAMVWKVWAEVRDLEQSH